MTTLSIQKSSPRLATSFDPIPNVEDEVRALFKAIPQDAVDRKDRIWQVVIAQKCGFDVLKAASVAAAQFQAPPPEGEVSIECLDKVVVKIPYDLFEALKKDAGILRNMACEIGIENLVLNVDSTSLNQILAVLYPEYNTAIITLNIVDQISIANYLEIPLLVNRLVKNLRKTIRLFSVSDYSAALKLYQLIRLSPLRTQSFFKDLIQVEFAEYFGYFLSLLTKIEDIKEPFEALTFDEAITNDFLAKLSQFKNLKHLRINRGSKLTTWPAGFSALESLVLLGFPIKNVTYPTQLKSLKVNYGQAHNSDLLPLPAPSDLRGFPEKLETLELSYYCNSIQLAHVPWVLKSLILHGWIYLIDLYMLPPTLQRFETESQVCNKKGDFPTTLQVLNLNYHSNAYRSSIKISDLKALNLIELTINDSLIEQLSSTLRRLSLVDIDPLKLSKLPPLLESLKAPVNGSYLQYLPNLRKLDLSTAVIKDDDLRYLRSDLEELIIDRSDITDKGISNIPKNLDRLALINLRYITNQGVAEIPRRVTQLTLSFVPINTCCFVYLPRHLEVLVIFGVMLDKNNYEHLPHTLEKFHTDSEEFKNIPGAKVYKI